MHLYSFMHKTLLLAVPGITVAQSLQPPYATPSFAMLSSNWPSASDWAALNSSVGGRLQALRPWAAVCYTSDPLYNAEACTSVIAGYTNDTQREAVPAALLWPNWEGCSFDQGCALNATNPQPVSGATCYQGTTPPYSVSIQSAKDASTIIKWATARNVKITVKSTGHDYQGRSAAPSSLQVNVHQLKNLSYVPQFVPQGSKAVPVPALKVGAGAQIQDIYKYAEANNVSPVVGACLTVGAGGYLQGGGTSVLTPAFGLGADNVLEVEVVTAGGQIRVANDVQNSDLFWALRGGGAGSWGIIISATISARPAVPIGGSLLSIAPNASQNATALGIEFLSLVGKYQNDLTNKGVAVISFTFLNTYALLFYWPTSHAQLSDLFPFFDELKSLSSNFTVVQNTTSASMFPSIGAAITQNVGILFEQGAHYGAYNQLASRLVPQSYLDPSEPSSIRSVAQAIWQGLETVNAPLQSKGVLGNVPVVILAGLPGASLSHLVDTTGANPALYSASWHVVFSASWTLGVDAATNSKVMTAIHEAVAPMVALGLESSYQNDGDAFESNWQQVYFGYKYAKLSAIKQKYDPQNYFTSYKGVASVTNLPAYQCYANKEQELLSTS